MTGRLRANEKVHYVASTTFTIDRNYSDLKLVGKGSYGVVCSANDTANNRKVAIKKITPMAKDIVDAKHVLREIRLMRHMGKHENIISLEDVMVRESADELYIVMELLDSDLHRVIQSPQALTHSHHRHFIHQLLCGVKYLHDNRIIHRDLKPGNLLVSRDCKLRITDFGLARERPTGRGQTLDDEIDEPMTEHVVTRWYRPPELMLCPDGLYTYAVDMWSVGCILAEMLARRPIFPGKNFIDQLTLIFDVIGSPQSHEVSHIQNSQAKKYLYSQRGKRPVPFERIFPEAPEEMPELLNGLLKFDPSARLSVDECLDHRLFSRMAPTASTVYPPTSTAFEFSFERTKTTKAQLKQMILGEVASVRRESVARRKGHKIPLDSTSGSTGVDDDDRSRVSQRSTGSQSQRSASTSRTTNRSGPPEPSSYQRGGHRIKGQQHAERTRATSTGRAARESNPIGRARRTSERGGHEGVPRGIASTTGRPKASTMGAQPVSSTNDSTGLPPAPYQARQREAISTVPAVFESHHERPSSPLADGSPQPPTGVESPSRRNRAAMRVLEDETCSSKAMQFLSKTSSGEQVVSRAEAHGDDTPSPPRSIRRGAPPVPDPVSDSDEEDVIARMRRMYGTERSETRTSVVATVSRHVGEEYEQSSDEESDLGGKAAESKDAIADEYSSQAPVESKISYEHIASDTYDKSVPGVIDEEEGKKDVADYVQRAQRHREEKHTMDGISSAAAARNLYSHAAVADRKPVEREHRVGEKETKMKRDNSADILGGSRPAGHKKGLTVPRSPQFSKMSWQKKETFRGGGQPAVPGVSHGKSRKSTGGTISAGRACSAPRPRRQSVSGDSVEEHKSQRESTGTRRADKHTKSSSRLGGRLY